MRTASKIASMVLLVVLGVSVGFGWGSATHAYFANHLGVLLGPLNQNEIYGATLPDLFGYDFSARGFVADYAVHTSKDLLWGLYGMASSREAKAGFYGFFTHNNINDPQFANMRGADWFAHGVYPEPLQPPDPDGWVIHQGLILVQNPAISSYIVGLIGPTAAQQFLPLAGHILIETAGDILLRRTEDPLIGARLALAATNRSNEIPQVLAAALSAGGLYSADTVQATEAAWRAHITQYGQLLLLPEPQLIALLSQQTASTAQKFLGEVFGIQPAPPVDPAKIAQFILIAINQIKPIFHDELTSTLNQLRQNMKNGPPPAGQIFAFWKDGEAVESTATTPAQFALGQNYPNPFNPSTTISYDVPTDGHITLKIFNSLGQEVATLVDDDVVAGRYTATWNASGVASGVYFYRLQSGSAVSTRKMTLLK